jgi:hypothetical protein
MRYRWLGDDDDVERGKSLLAKAGDRKTMKRYLIIGTLFLSTMSSNELLETDIKMYVGQWSNE